MTQPTMEQARMKELWWRYCHLCEREQPRRELIRDAELRVATCVTCIRETITELRA